MSSKYFLSLLIIAISLNTFSQKLDLCDKNNDSVLTPEESDSLNAYLSAERKEFDFKNKKILFVTGNSGNLIGCKEQYFAYINEWKKIDSKVASGIYIFTTNKKSISGGYDAIITYWVKVFTEKRKRKLIEKVGKNQGELEFEILESIIKYEISNEELYIQCQKPRTYFDRQDFIEQVSYDLQIEIIQELEKNASISKGALWNSKWMTDLSKKYNSLNNRNCITKNDVSKLFEKTKKRNSVLTISDPIFSNNNEYCIVSISYLMFPGSAYGNSYFLQKVQGEWTILASYDNWLS
ncbi:hypothetical protein [uncultured Christiangramia sp.]|uniref:hypothetical protein n=1 Tax=Christiangramia sp. 3-2217-3z TaxID=3417564 RepID=UPI00260AF5BC|nr:hypothetical protein [uncultured Christiangramia sp.]